MLLKLKPSVSFFPIHNNLYHIYDSHTTRHFKLGKQEVGWLQSLDGHTSTENLRDLIPREYYDDFIGHVRRMDLVEGGDSVKKLDLLKIKTKLFNPDRLLDQLVLFSRIYSTILFIATPILVIVNIVLTGLAWSRVNALNANMLSLPWHIGFFVACIIISGVLHEISHALVAKAYGVHVPVIGFMFMLFYPAFYADVSGINLLPKYEDRIRVLVAGICCNNAILFFALAIFLISPSALIQSYAAIVIASNLTFALFNLIPFVEYDGYYILCELIGDPRFAVTSRTAVLTRRDIRLSHIVYFMASNIFVVALIYLLVDAIRRFALPWSGAMLGNTGAVLLFFAAVAAVSSRILRSNGVR